MMSLPVVMNGPVAIAGSIPKRSRIIGTEVPIRAATIITQIIDADIVKLMSIGWLIANPKRKLFENLCIYNIKDVKVNLQCIYEIIYFMDDKLIYEEYNNPIFNLMVDDNIIQLNDYIV